MTESKTTAPPRLLILLAASALGVSATGQASAQARAKADASCRPAGATLQYDCTVKLIDARTKEPLAGASVTVGADMPSMPMAHNIRPAKAAPAAEPGAYELRLELEMHGDWALRIDVAGPVRDRVIVPLRFEDKIVRPSRPRAAPRPLGPGARWKPAPTARLRNRGRDRPRNVPSQQRSIQRELDAGSRVCPTQVPPLAD